MKVVMASTPEQEDHIQELADYFYSDIFPMYFTDEEIVKFKELHIMSLKNVDKNYNGTLKEAFQLISSLQALIAVLEAIGHKPIEVDDRYIFEKNIKTLKEYGLSFPFHIDHFSPSNLNIISTFSKPFNQLLI